MKQWGRVFMKNYRWQLANLPAAIMLREGGLQSLILKKTAAIHRN